MSRVFSRGKEWRFASFVVGYQEFPSSWYCFANFRTIHHLLKLHLSVNLHPLERCTLTLSVQHIQRRTQGATEHGPKVLNKYLNCRYPPTPPVIFIADRPFHDPVWRKHPHAEFKLNPIMSGQPFYAYYYGRRWWPTSYCHWKLLRNFNPKKAKLPLPVMAWFALKSRLIPNTAISAHSCQHILLDADFSRSNYVDATLACSVLRCP